MKHLVFWRTAIVVLVLGLMLLAALVLCLRHPDVGALYFGHAVTGIIGLAAIAAGKSAVEHLANGGGLLGTLKVLSTSAKPEATP